MSYKKVEIESFFKAFILFFVSMTLLVGVVFIMNFKERVKTLDETLFSQMKLCSYTLDCEAFDIDFVPDKRQETYKLYKSDDALRSYFPILSSRENLLAISLKGSKYHAMLQKIRFQSIVTFIFIEIAVFVLSILFSLYAIFPLRNALRLTEEFIRDILHDFNTPIATIMLNASMLEKKFPSEEKFRRILNSLHTITLLQENLKAYLNKSLSSDETFALEALVNERVEEIRRTYPTIEVSVAIPSKVTVQTQKNSFIRILDNILTNAFKYNKPHGYVRISYENDTLYIEDGGIGIKNPKRVFERFYKENDRGIGIGLHIVLKLCEMLGIKVSLRSRVGEGTIFKLDLGKITKKI